MNLQAVIALSFVVLVFVVTFFPAISNRALRKPQKQDEPGREVRNRYPDWPPEVFLEAKLIHPGNPADLEKAQWLWINRPKPDRWDGPILQAAVALLASLPLSPLLGPSLAGWLAKWSLLCVAFFFWRQGREMKRWDRWKADYYRALDRLKFDG